MSISPESKLTGLPTTPSANETSANETIEQRPITHPGALLPTNQSHHAQVIPIWSSEDPSLLSHYQIISPTGKQEFIVAPTDPMFKPLLAQTLDNLTNVEEGTLPIQIANRAKQLMEDMGVPKADLPRTPEETLTRLQGMANQYLGIEETRQDIIKVNAMQALLQKYIETLNMNPLQYMALAPITRHSLAATHSAITTVIAQQIGVDADTVKTSEHILKIQNNMTASARLVQAALALIGGVTEQIQDVTAEGLPAIGEGIVGIFTEGIKQAKGLETNRQKRKAKKDKGGSGNTTIPNRPILRPSPSRQIVDIEQPNGRPTAQDGTTRLTPQPRSTPKPFSGTPSSPQASDNDFPHHPVG